MSIRIIGIGSIAGRPRYEVRDPPGKNADRKNGVRSPDVTGVGGQKGFHGRACTLPKFCGKFFDQLELLFFHPLRRCMSLLTGAMGDATAQRDFKLMLETRRRTFVLGRIWTEVHLRRGNVVFRARTWSKPNRLLCWRRRREDGKY